MTLPAILPRPVTSLFDRPHLLVVVDTEEEFAWDRPFDRRSTATATIPAQDRVHAIYDRYGVVPTYVMDYPVATAPASAAYLRRLVDAGRAAFGTHCHPWVTPPYAEEVNERNSYHGNLPAALEAEKLAESTKAVADAMGSAPRIFKAGRYGLGPHSFEALLHLGYTLDCSIVPHTSFSADHGPDFRGMPAEPFFTDSSCRLLEVPLTVGYSGLLHGWGRRCGGAIDHPALRTMRIPGIASRLRLLERAKLSPEGFDAAILCRLMRALVAQGQQVFTLAYHSPSLAPGYTPYVRTESDLANFLQRIDTVLRFFRDALGGAFTTLAAVEHAARAAAKIRLAA
jgi:hypothetical protein